MKINNETKIGALTAVALTLLILGFNFLKGKSVFKRGNFIYARYEDTKGLMPSYPVNVNGYSIGAVNDIEEADKSLTSIIVSIKLKDDYEIPDNSIAYIKQTPLSTPNIEIVLGNSKTFLKNGDTIQTQKAESSVFGELTAKVGPVADQLNVTLKSLDSVLRSVEDILNPMARANMQQMLSNLNKASGSIAVSAESLRLMADPKTGALYRTVGNVNSFTKNLADNNGRINNMMANLDKTTTNLASADIKAIVNKLDSTSVALNQAVSKINSNEGSLGALINDKQLYLHLNNTARSLNILMDDIRVNPKRYVHLNFAVFGKKTADNDYLKAPLIDSANQKR